MATPAADTELHEEEAPAPKIRRKRLPIIIGAVIAAAAIGAAAYWFLGRGPAAEADPEPEEATAVEVAPTYLALENFTVNLQPEGGDQYLQVALNLKIADPTAVESLKTRMPEVRNRILLLLSSKRASELSSTAGKEHLGVEIQGAINRIFTPETAEDNVAAGAITPATPAEPGREEAPAAGAPAPVAEEKKPEHPGAPVSGVLFTAFIIQ